MRLAVTRGTELDQRTAQAGKRGELPGTRRCAQRAAIEIEQPDALCVEQDIVCVQVRVIRTGGVKFGDAGTDARRISAASKRNSTKPRVRSAPFHG